MTASCAIQNCSESPRSPAHCWCHGPLLCHTAAASSVMHIPSEHCALIAPTPPELVGGAPSRMLTLLRSSVPEPIGPRPVLVLLQLLAGGICAGLPMTVPPAAVLA